LNKKYPKIYKFLEEKKWLGKNIQIIDLPVGNHMYIENGNIITNSFKVDFYDVNDELGLLFKYTKTLYVFPYKDFSESYLYNYDYDKYLRMWTPNDMVYIMQRNRLRKLKRILEE